MMRASLVAAFLVALALATGCEDTPLFAGKDYKMSLVASPDPDPDVQFKWDIYATIVNDANIPQSGITVFFSTNGGSLGSEGDAVTTGSDGRAHDVLIVLPEDPESITVTATSAALSKTVTVATGICTTNTAPTAQIEPPDAQTLPGGTLGATVNASTLSGSSSSDTQTAATALSYTWTCVGGTSTSGRYTDSSVTCAYTYQSTLKTYTIKLVVKDNGLEGHPECALSSADATVTVNVPAGTAAP